MKIYLDICSFNRPYDDQTHIKIKLEAEAKLFIQRAVKEGIKSDDALHIACAISAKCNYFITTDYKLIKKAATLNQIHVLNPVDYIRILEDKK